MKKKRNIALVVYRVRMDDEDAQDLLFWLNRSISDRLTEVGRLRKNYYTWKYGVFPEKMEKVVHYRKL